MAHRGLPAPDGTTPDDPGDLAWQDRIDPQALLIALVLVPNSYPRNRYFSLFRWPAANHVRRRAAQIRSVVRDLTSDVDPASVEAVSHAGAEAETTLSYRLPELNARRSIRLSELELGLVQLGARRARAALNQGEAARPIAALEDIRCAVAADLERHLARLL